MAAQQVRFGDQLRRFREAAGFSQEALAERAGLSANAVSALERGERKRPYPDTLRRLADALMLAESDRAALVATLTEPQARPAQPPEPLPRPAETAPLELPGEPTPLIGRERECDVVRHLLTRQETRLLTLTGPGGVGKTRLALHVAREVEGMFPDGIAWVELAPLSDPRLILPTLVRALGLEDSLSGDPAQVLRTHLRGRRMLLVLDNFEHLIDGAAELADLLRACHTLTLLVTSRAALSVRGEQEYVVPPLQVPFQQHEQRAEEVATAPSAQLFIWLARQKDPGFALDEGNAATIAAICRRLDGLPLALELAAARVRLLGPAGLLSRLERTLPVLTGGPRDLPERHRTMEAAIRWSYDLLRPAEQALFRSLAVFSGGWTVEAAERISGNLEGTDDILDGLTALADQSLVRQIPGHDDAPRLTMLETLREFGLQQLTITGEIEEIQRAHLEWCVDLAEAAEQGLVSPDQPAWLDRLETEHDNIRTALRTPLQGAEELRLRLVGALWRFWWWHSHFTEGRAWLAEVLLQADEPQSVYRAKALTAAGILAREQADYEQALTFLTEGLKIRRALGDVRGTAQSLNILGLLANSQGDFPRSLGLLDQALALYREAGDQLGIANVTNNMGNVLRDEGKFEEAADHFIRSMEMYRERGEQRGKAVTLHNLGRVFRDMGDRDRAMQLFDECLLLERELGDRVNAALTLHNIGRVAKDEGDLVRAAELFAESLHIRSEFGDKLGCIKVVEDVIDLAIAAQQWERAVLFSSVTEGLRAAMGAPVPPADREHIDESRTRAREGVDATIWARLYDEGRGLGADRMVDDALTFLRQFRERPAIE